MEDRMNMENEMSNEEKKEYLNGYRNICLRICNLQEQLEEVQETASSVRSQQLSDMPKAGKRHRDVSDLLVKIESLEDRIDEEIHQSIEKRIEIENVLLEVEDAREAKVLRLRYIKFMKWEEVQEEMCYSIKQIQRIHDKAIRHLRMSYHVASKCGNM